MLGMEKRNIFFEQVMIFLVATASPSLLVEAIHYLIFPVIGFWFCVYRVKVVHHYFFKLFSELIIN